MKWMLKYLGGGSIRWGKLDNNLLFNVLGDKSNPTRALTTSTSCAIITKEKEEEGDSLYNRLLPFGDPEMSMLPILDKWIIEERPIEAYQLRNIIKGFRKYKRFKHALQVPTPFHFLLLLLYFSFFFFKFQIINVCLVRYGLEYYYYCYDVGVTH